MGFFRRFKEGLGHSTPVAGMAEAAASWGWKPVEGDPLDSGLTSAVHLVARTLHGAFAKQLSGMGSAGGFGGTFYHDAYTGTVGGRAVTVANAWIPIEALVAGGKHLYGSSIVAVELTTILPIVGIEPRDKMHEAFRGRELSSGNAAFDEAYRVLGIEGMAETVLTPDFQQRIAAREDWAFVAQDTTFVSICAEPFATADEVSDRANAIVGIVMAIPASVAPSQVDHSVDDLLVRLAGIDKVDDAIAILQQLSDADRQRLAASPTPLAKFADVRTPDQAVARLMELPEFERLQVLALFKKADGG
jgi:hypothetical protein